MARLVGRGEVGLDGVRSGRQGMVECGVVVKGMARQAWFGAVRLDKTRFGQV